MDGVDDVPLAKKYGERRWSSVTRHWHDVTYCASHGVTDWHHANASDWSDCRLVLSVQYPVHRKFDIHCNHLHTQLLEFAHRTSPLIMLPGYPWQMALRWPYHVQLVSETYRKVYLLRLVRWNFRNNNCLLESYCYQLGLWCGCQISRILAALLSGRSSAWRFTFMTHYQCIIGAIINR